MMISEIFYSIQGEGELTGVPSVFVRLSGCNLRCGWCDTPYASWKPEGKNLSVKDVLKKINSCPSRFCVITGGEPLLSKEVWQLCRDLRRQGKHITIETNGTISPEGIPCDLASLSPKLSNSEPAGKENAELRKTHNRIRIQPEALKNWLAKYNFQLKFVVSSEKDIRETKALLRKLSSKIPPEKILLMPEGRKKKDIASKDMLIVNICKKYGYRYCRRVHIDLFGDKKGV